MKIKLYPPQFNFLWKLYFLWCKSPNLVLNANSKRELNFLSIVRVRSDYFNKFHSILNLLFDGFLAIVSFFIFKIF